MNNLLSLFGGVWTYIKNMHPKKFVQLFRGAYQNGAVFPYNSGVPEDPAFPPRSVPVSPAGAKALPALSLAVRRRMSRKKPVRIAEHSSASTPPFVSSVWLRRLLAASSSVSARPFCSYAPKTTRRIRAFSAAPMHIGQGSSVT